MSEVCVYTARPHRLWSSVIKRARELIAQREIILLVPEQFSVSAEVEILAGLQMDGSLHLEVTTPTRLYQRYVRIGDISEAPLEKTGFYMAMAQATENLWDKLEYFRFTNLDLGFIGQICSVITDMKRGSVSPQMLLEYAERADNATVKAKYHDLALLYSQYINVMDGRFSEGEDKLSFLGSLLIQTDSLRDTSVLVYGFDTLTNQLLDLLDALARLCPSLDIFLCCDSNRYGDGRLYSSVHYSIEGFSERLQINHIPLKHIIIRSELENSHPFFRELDHRLFSNLKNPSQIEQTSEGNLPILVQPCATPLDEAEWTAKHIRALIENGANPSEICVMYPQSAIYDSLIPLVLTEYGIPCFSNPKLHLRNHRLPQFLISALSCIADGWRQQDVLDVLHSGYSSLTLQESAVLENYITVNHINRSLFLKPFTRGRNPEKTAEAEEIRLRFIQPLLVCKEALLEAKNGWESTKAVYQLLVNVHAAETYQASLNEMCSHGLQERFCQEQPIWDCVIRVLEQMALVADQKRIPLRHIAFRLQCGLSAVSMSILPYGNRNVQAGYIDHMIQLHADYVFLCGLNEDFMESEQKSLIADEKKDLETFSNSFLGVNERSTEAGLLLALKSAMTLPAKGLHITWPLCGAQGDTRGFFSGLKPELERLAPVECRMKDYLKQTSLSIPQIAELVRSKQVSELSRFSLDTEAMRQLKIMLSRPPAEVEPSLRPQTAEKLYHGDVMSVSQLESFQACPFSYYLKYGLKLQEKEDWAVNQIDTGNFYHNALHRIGKKLRQASPESLSAKDIAAISQEAILPLKEDLLNGPYGDGSFARAQLQEAEKTVCDSALMIWNHLMKGKLRIWKTEQSFGYPGGMPPIILVLPDGRQKLLRGRIDRIDYFDKDNERYLCVVDYKSSSHSLEPGKTWEGLQLQLLLYLLACVQSQKGTKPAGAFYFWIHQATSNENTTLREKAEQAIQKKFRLNGFSLSNIEISDVIDAKYLSEEQLDSMLQHVYSQAASICQNLLNGQISTSPSQDSNVLQCDYCSYRRDCRFSPLSETDKIRYLQTITFEELIHLLLDNGKREPESEENSNSP